MHRIEVRRLAEIELAEAAEWYSVQRPGVGDEFLEQVLKDSQAIAEAPQRWPVYIPGVRRYVMSRFPFLIYYKVEAETVVILRVVHGSRDPEAVKRGLG